MTLFHLNVEEFKLFGNIQKYISSKNPDIICFQEAVNDKNKIAGDSFGLGEYLTFFEDNGYKIVFAPWLLQEFETNTGYHFGNAILVKSHIQIQNVEILWDEMLGKTFSIRNQEIYDQVNSKIKTDRNNIYQYIQKETKNYIILTLKTGQKILKIATTHWMATKSCTDCQSDQRMSKIWTEYCKNERLPVILTGDFNLEYEKTNNSLSRLAEQMDTKTEFANTLDPHVHYVLINNILPGGLGVDHVFSKNISKIETKLETQTLSDHLGIWVDFEV
jgi:endonuclease/exonuclease/phosphatase family metal-dependent hydrolase